jgi:hypothetical protein
VDGAQHPREAVFDAVEKRVIESSNFISLVECTLDWLVACE